MYWLWFDVLIYYRIMQKTLVKNLFTNYLLSLSKLYKKFNIIWDFDSMINVFESMAD